MSLVLTAATGCSAAIRQLDIDAAQLAARVTTAIVNDPTIGTRAIGVRVGHDGVVYLSGRVLSQAEVSRAADVARSVAGVTRVESSIQVGGAPPVEGDRGFRGRRDPAPNRDPELEFAELETTYERLALGASVGWSDPRSGTLDSRVALGPLIKIGAGTGVGPAIGFDWFKAAVADGRTADVAATSVRVRPVMVGLSYTMNTARLALSPSLVGGYAFNSLTVPKTGTAAGRLAVDIDNSFVWRPGVSLWIRTGGRTTVNVSLGRVMTRLQMTFIEDGRLDKRRVNGNTTVVHAGVAYKLF